MNAKPHRAAWAVLLCACLLIGGAGHAVEGAESETLAGQLLVASSSMPDGFFAHTVIYMLQHDDSGALGVVVNHPMGEIPFSSLFEGLGVEPEIDHELTKQAIKIYNGGPVEAGQGFILHPGDYLDGDRSGDIIGLPEGLVLSMNIDMVRAMAAGEGPSRSLLLFGYSGWAPGQLERELKRDDWIAVPADENLVFDGEDDTKWNRAMDRLGVDL